MDTPQPHQPTQTPAKRRKPRALTLSPGSPIKPTGPVGPGGPGRPWQRKGGKKTLSHERKCVIICSRFLGAAGKALCLFSAPQNPPQSSLCARAWQMGAAEPREQGGNATYCWAFRTRGAFHQHSLSKRKGKNGLDTSTKSFCPQGNARCLSCS